MFDAPSGFRFLAPGANRGPADVLWGVMWLAGGLNGGMFVPSGLNWLYAQ